MEGMRWRSDDEECFNIFQTFSYADMHWRGLHELFPESKEYLDKEVSKWLHNLCYQMCHA